MGMYNTVRFQHQEFGGLRMPEIYRIYYLVLTISTKNERISCASISC